MTCMRSFDGKSSGTMNTLARQLVSILAFLAAGATFASGLALAAGSDILTTHHLAVAGKQSAKALVLDSGNNVIMAGSDGDATTVGQVVKQRADGSGPAWQAALDPVSGIEVITAVAVDHNDDIVVAGYAHNGSNFDMLTAKLAGGDGTVLWLHRHQGPAAGDDFATAIAVDPLNNVYVTGYGQAAAGNDDILLLKFPPSGPGADGQPLWAKSYNAAGNGHDRAYAIAVGPDGVAVTGEAQNAVPDFDMLTLKYGFDGSLGWFKSYFDTGDGRGQAVRMTSAGDVVVTGFVAGTSSRDLYVARYPADGGTTVWVASYNGGYDDEGLDLWLDAADEVFVSGTTFALASAKDLFYARYAADNGTEVWRKSYNSFNGDNDYGIYLAGDDAGSLFVAGYDDNAASGLDDMLLLKCRQDNGTLLWARNVDGATGDDRAVGLAITSNGDPVLGGWSDFPATGEDFLAVRLDAGHINPPTGLTAATQSNSSVTLAWVDNATGEEGFVVERRLGSLGTFAPIATLGAGVTTYPDSGLAADTRYDYRVKALSSVEGDSLFSNVATARTTMVNYDPPDWQFSYDGDDHGDDYPQAIAVGPDGHPVVTGYSFALDGAFDYLTLKLDRAAMSPLWSARYNDGDHETDIATALAVGPDNRVIVTGYASLFGGGSGNTNDIYTLGYAAGGPPAVWSDQYNGPSGDDDRSAAVSAAADGSGGVAVVGYGKNVSWNDDIYVLKYQADGGRVWAAVPYDQGGNDYPVAVGLNAAGDVFVAGRSSSAGNDDIFVARYAAATGVRGWTDLYDGTGHGIDYAADLVVDADGNLYVTGYSSSAAGNGDIITIKYDGATGTRLWVRTFDGGVSGYDTGVAVGVDPLDKSVVVAGTSFVGAGNHDIVVLRYGSDGTLTWQKSIDLAGGDEAAVALAIDANGTIAIAGTTGSTGAENMVGVKYAVNGEIIGATVFAGSAGNEDVAVDITVNRFGEAFVAGHSINAAGNADFQVFKVDGTTMQPPLPVTSSPLYTSLTLNWQDNSIDEAGFEIERRVGTCDDGNGWTAVHSALPGQTSYVDSGLNPAATYCYRLRSFNAGGDTSRWAEHQVDTQLAPAPTGLQGTVQSSTLIDLDWTDTTTGESDFLLERCTGSDCDFSTVDSFFPAANTTIFHDDTVCSGNSYRYRIMVRQAGVWTSAFSVPTGNLTTPVAVPPTGLTLGSVTEASVLLGWNHAAGREGEIVVERCAGSSVDCTADEDFAAVGSVAATTGELLLHYRFDEAAWNGTAGEVRDTSANNRHGQGMGGADTTDTGRFARAGIFDGTNDVVVTPLTINQTATGTGATLSAWVLPSNLSGYRVVIGTDNGGYDWGLMIYNGLWYIASGNGYESTTIAVNFTQWQHVAAVFQPGTGIHLYVNGVLAKSLPLASLGFDASTSTLSIGRNGQANYYYGGQIDEVAVFGVPLDAPTVMNLYSQGVNRYTDTTAAANTAYTYRVRNQKAAACGWATAPSNLVEVQTVPQPPSKPVAAVLSTTRVVLTWQDNTLTETGFRIERCAGDGCSDFAVVATVGANVTRFIDPTPCAATNYSYRVVAERTSAWSSLPSAIVTVTTAAPQLPAGLIVTGTSEERIDLKWNYPDTDFDSYRVARCLGDAAACTLDAQYTTVQESNGLFAGALLLYHFDEGYYANTASEVNDASGQGRHGTPTGLAATESGMYGTGATLTGGSAIATPVNLDQSATSPGATFEAWVYPTSTASSYRFLFGTENGGSDWGVAQYGSTWYLSNGTSYVNTGIAATANQWQHIVVTVTPGSGFRFYLNGGAPVLFTSISYDASDGNVVVGNRGDGNYPYIGSIDDVAIYNRPLSDQEVQDRFSRTLRFGEGGLPSGTTWQYRVSAHKAPAGGCGWDGTPVQIEAATLTLPPPENFTATAVNTTQVDLTWIDRTTTETGFTLERCIRDPGVVECDQDVQFTNLAAPLANAQNFSDTSVCAGSSLVYRIRADKTTDPAWATAWATAAAITPTVAQPDTFIATAVSESVVQLSWRDTTSDENEFQIERCEGNLANCTEDGSFTGVTVMPGTLAGNVLLYRMDEAAWTGVAGEVRDESGRNNHGQVFGGATTVATGKYDRAGNLAGSDDYIVTPVLLNQATGSAGATMEAWVYPTNTSNYGYLFSTDNGSYDWGLSNRYGTWYVANGTSSLNTGVPVTLNQWQHVALVIDPAVGYKLYINGVQLKTGAVTYEESSGPLVIGAWPTNAASSYRFVGRIDEAAVYDLPLTAAQVQQHVQARINSFGHVDNGLAPATTYVYRVKARKNSSCSWTSAPGEVEVTTLAPPAPTTLTATPINTTQIDLSWQDNASSETAYRVERCPGTGIACDDDAEYALLVQLGPSAVAYQDPSVCSGQEYSYRVRAERDVIPIWQTAWAGPQSAATAVPTAPASLTAVRASEVQINLNWIDNSSDESGFLVQRCPGAGIACDEDGEFTDLATLAAETIAYQDDSLVPGGSYTYRLRAFKTAACSWTTDWSVTASATATILSPGTLLATAVNTTQIDLTWTDTAATETATIINRCTGSGCSDYAEIGRVGPGPVRYADTSVCNGVTYRYQIQSRCDGLSGSGCWTRRVPLSFTAFVAGKTVELTVLHDADMLANFGDLRFYDETRKRQLPYWIQSKTDGVSARVLVALGSSSQVSMYYGNPLATDDGQMEQIAEYATSFAGTVINAADWVEIDPDGSIAQNSGLILNDVSDAWSKALISTRTFARTADKEIYLDLTIPADTAGNNHFMVGWDANQTTDPSYAQLTHGFYWDNYYLTSYEKGAHTGPRTQPYAADTSYEARIVLLATGARYYVRGGAYTNWTLVKETLTYSDSPLRIGITQYSHQAKINSLQVRNAITEMGATFGSEEQSACFAFGNTWVSGVSNSSEATTPVPTAPSGLAATASTDNQIELHWTDASTDEGGFEIERCNGSACSDFAPLLTVAANTTAHSDGGLSPSSHYTYRLRAVKSADCGWETAYTSPAAAQTLPQRSGTLTAVPVNSRKIQLSWSDQASDEDGYEIEVQLWNGRFMRTGLVGANTTDYVDTVGIEPQKTYVYRVRPFRGSGYAPYSNDASATTPAFAEGDNTCH